MIYKINTLHVHLVINDVVVAETEMYVANKYTQEQTST